MQSTFPNLLSPIRIRNMEVRNRIVVSAYQTNLGQGYRPTPQLAAYHAARARGGVGLIILEGVRAHPTTRGAPANFDGWDEEAIPQFRAVVDAVHQQGAKIIGQTFHMGRTADSTLTLLPTWSASRVLAPPVFGLNTSELTHPMTKDEIQEVIRWWARCALNLKHAGMDGVEIHAGHGYLVQQFLSPLTNFRLDEYGGSLRNRARFALELVSYVRQAIGRDIVLGIRISADELVPGGLTLEHTTQVARWLEDSGDLDYLSISHSTSEPMSHAAQVADMSWPQAPFVYLAEAIKKATRGIPIFTVCRIIDPYIAEGILAEGKADMVCMARAHIADPEIGRKLAEGRPQDIRQCIGCNQGCAGRINAGLSVGCLINPEAGREYELGAIMPAVHRKSVVVVGGGPAGMEAARVAALRGHSVTLYERRGHLGGQITTLIKAPHRQEFGKIVPWLEGQLKQLGVDIRLKVEVTRNLLAKQGFEAAVIATGSVPVLPDFPGLPGGDGPARASADDVLQGEASGSRVVLLDGDGHHKALSTAEFLAHRGAQVHLVTKAPFPGVEITTVSQTPAVRRLIEIGVAFYCSSWVKEVAGRSIKLHNLLTGHEQTIESVDLIVPVLANRPLTELYEDLKDNSSVPQVVAVGDCVSPRRALEAMREGHMAARSL